MNPKRYLGCIFSLPHSFGSNVGVVPAGTKDLERVSSDKVDYHQVLVWKPKLSSPVENETIGSGRSQGIEEDDKEKSRPKFPPFSLLVRLLPLSHFYVRCCYWISLKGFAESCHRIVLPKKVAIFQTPLLVNTKPKTDISFDSNNAIPHNTPQHVTYHRDLDVRSILVYWDTLPEVSEGRLEGF